MSQGMAPEADQLSLDQIQAYLNDLGYEGVPEDTLIQLRTELVSRLSRTQDSEDMSGRERPESAGFPAPAEEQVEGSLRRRQRQRHGDAPRPPAPERRPADARYTYDEPDELDVLPEEPPRASRRREGQRPASARETADQRISELYGRSPQRREGDDQAKRSTARPATAGSTSGRSGRFTTYGQTYNPYEAAPRGANASYRHCMDYTPGKSRYTLAEKKARGSDPVSYYAQMEARWSKQGAPEDGKKWREYQERQRRIRTKMLGQVYY